MRTTPPDWLKQSGLMPSAPPAFVCEGCGLVHEDAEAELRQAHQRITELLIENGAIKDRAGKLEVQVKNLLIESDRGLKRKPEYKDALRVLDHWQQACMPKAKEPYSARRLRNVIARLAAKEQPFTVEELMRAADGYAAFPYVVNRRRAEHGSPADRKADAELIYREATFVQQGLSLAAEAEQRARPLPSIQRTVLSAPALGVLGSAAVKWAELGFEVFPTMPRSKEPIPRSGGLKDATRDVTRIARFWARCPEHNVAVRCGIASSLVVLDVDGEEGNASLRTLEAKFGPLPRTGSVVTPGGGSHFYFRHPEAGEIRNTTGFPGPGLDVRGQGGYVLVPPSIGRSGRAYEVDEAAKRQPMPDWLIRLLVERQSSRSSTSRDYALLVRVGARQGERNNDLLRLAGHLWSHGHNPNEVLEIVLAVNHARCRPPLTNPECKKIVDSVGRMRAQEALRLNVS